MFPVVPVIPVLATFSPVVVATTYRLTNVNPLVRFEVFTA
jgi:hypothetical protein